MQEIDSASVLNVLQAKPKSCSNVLTFVYSFFRMRINSMCDSSVTAINTGSPMCLALGQRVRTKQIKIEERIVQVMFSTYHPYLQMKFQ